MRSDSPEAFYSCSDVMFGSIDSEFVPAVGQLGIEDTSSRSFETWKASVAYSRGDVVEHGGALYRAVRWSLGAAPRVGGSRATVIVWEPFGESIERGTP